MTATVVCHGVKFFGEAAGVEPENLIETAQLIDSEKARIGMISGTAKSTVRSLYSLSPNVHNSQTPPSDGPFGEKSILKCACSISQILPSELFVGPEFLNLAIPTPAGPNEMPLGQTGCPLC